MRSRAFTLIEVLLVLMLVTLLATVSALSLRGPARVATMEEAIDLIEHLARTARDRAARTGETHFLIIDLDKAIIQIKKSSSEADATMIAFAESAQPSAIWISNRPVKSGEIAIPFQPNGGSPAYAITISDTTATARRLLVLGPTGQTLEMNDDESTAAFFSMQESRIGYDAD